MLSNEFDKMDGIDWDGVDGIDWFNPCDDGDGFHSSDEELELECGEGVLLYKRYMDEVEDAYVKIEAPDKFAKRHQVDAIEKGNKGFILPIMIKQIYKNAKGKQKSFDKIEKTRQWLSKKFSKTWPACRKAMTAYKCECIMVVLFIPKTKEILPAYVDSDQSILPLGDWCDEENIRITVPDQNPRPKRIAVKVACPACGKEVNKSRLAKHKRTRSCREYGH